MYIYKKNHAYNIAEILFLFGYGTFRCFDFFFASNHFSPHKLVFSFFASFFYLPRFLFQFMMEKKYYFLTNDLKPETNLFAPTYHGTNSAKPVIRSYHFVCLHEVQTQFLFFMSHWLISMLIKIGFSAQLRGTLSAMWIIVISGHWNCWLFHMCGFFLLGGCCFFHALFFFVLESQLQDNLLIFLIWINFLFLQCAQNYFISSFFSHINQWWAKLLPQLLFCQ